MIKLLSLKGFKSFLSRDLELNKLTILTGLNSSGKSSIIQAILMLEKAFNRESSILLKGHGGVNELKNKSLKGNIQIGIEINSDENFYIQLLAIQNKLGYKKLANSRKLKDISFPEIWYVSANRFGPRSSIPIFSDSKLFNKIGPNGENVLQCIKFYEYEALNSLLVHPNSEGNALIFNIRSWLNVISPNTEFNYNLDEKSDTSYTTFNDFRSTNVGFGLSYILPVITTLLVATLIPNTIVIIENPEAHLHPKGQTEIAKLISLCAQTGTQVLIETHSDHIFDGIRISTKEAENFYKDVQFHWFELDENKFTSVSSPSIDKNGRFSEWPNGFFDQFEKNASELI